MQIILTKGNFNTNSCHDTCVRLSLNPKRTIKQAIYVRQFYEISGEQHMQDKASETRIHQRRVHKVNCKLLQLHSLTCGIGK